MGFVDDLTGLADEPLQRMRCSIGMLIDALPTDEAKALIDALSDADKVRPAGLARVLKSYGHHISEQTIRRHRRRECRCPEDEHGAG